MIESRLHGRRRFLMLVGLAGLTSSVNSTMQAWAQSGTGKTAPARVPGPPGVNVPAKVKPDPAKTAAEAEPAISDDAHQLTGVIERRYGRHLNSKQLEAVAREIEDRIQGGKRLRQVRLANSDEPDYTFHAS